jgi:hypothetical protein
LTTVGAGLLSPARRSDDHSLGVALTFLRNAIGWFAGMA